MTQIIQRKINESSLARWTVLFIVSIVMMMGYVVAKEMSPLQYFLELPPSEGGLGWTSSEFGLFSGSRGFFNVYLLMLFISGVILDKTGVRFAGMLSCILMFAGTAIDYYAIAIASPVPTCEITFPLLGLDHAIIKQQVVTSALGFAVFGIGYELCGITVSKVIVKWFSGKEMALAMGIQVALARLGTALALLGGPFLAEYYHLSTPILVGLLSVGIAVVFYLLYCSMDHKFDRNTNAKFKAEQPEEKFTFKGLLPTLCSPGFWMITLLCMLYYSALYPFLDFASKMMITKYDISPEWAGGISSILPFTSIILTPLFGGVYDSVGKGASIMILGTIMLTVVLMVFALPFNSPILALALMLILGVAFSLLPSVLWPAVPKIVPEQQLGTAYSIIYYIQNIGLMAVPILIGNVLDSSKVDSAINYAPAMWIFTGIGALAILVSAILLVLDKKHHYGLQDANVKE